MIWSRHHYERHLIYRSTENIIEIENNIEQLLRPNVILKNCLRAGKRNLEDKHKELIWRGKEFIKKWKWFIWKGK